MSLHISKWGTGYAVFDGNKRVSGQISNNRDIALRVLDRMEIEAKQAESGRNRPCLCCSTEFWSTGPGHRMCPTCRARVRGLDNQMLGV